MYDSQVWEIEEDILSGKRPAGKNLIQCIKRHRKDLEDGHERGIYFDEEIGEEVLTFAESLNDYKGEPTQLFWWQRLELYYFFGWRRAGGVRRFRTSYISMARKNQKTITRPPKIFYHILMEGEYAPEVYISATKEDQAKICFDDVKTILANNPDLMTIFGSTSERIFSVEYKAKIGFLTSNPSTADGLRPSYGQIDEYHEFVNDGMIDKLRTAMGPRDEKILEIITTRGSDKFKPCYMNEQKVYLPVLHGDLIDDSTFVLIFDSDEEDDIFDPKTWYKANPNMGITIKEENFREDLERAINGGSETLNRFKTLNLNMWVDADVTWIEDEVWRRNDGELKLSNYKGKQCYAALDMAMKDDFCALSLAFPKRTDKSEGWRDRTEFDVFWWFWITKDSVKKRVQSGLHAVQDWILDGHISVVDGNYVSHAQIQDKIVELSKMFQIETLCFDPFNIGSIVEACFEHEIPTREFPQTMMNHTGPTKWFQELVLSGRFHHGNNPVMRWMIRNAVIIADSNENIRVTKDPKRRRDKVDGVIAAIMAVGGYYYKEEEVAFRIS